MSDYPPSVQMADSLCELHLMPAGVHIARFPYDILTIKKQRHFLIVTSEKSRFARHLTCFVLLDQKTPGFFDPNLESQVPIHIPMIVGDFSRTVLIAKKRHKKTKENQKKFAGSEKISTFAIPNEKSSLGKCGNSSVGRAQPCQGWGREFESRFPLQKSAEMLT